MHFALVTIALFSNQIKSTLFERLSNVTAPYTRTLNIDAISDTKYQLTHALDYEDDYYFEIEFEGGKTFYLPDFRGSNTGSRFSERFARCRRLVRRAAFDVVQENDSALAEYSRSIGRHFMSLGGSDRLVVRLYGFRPPSWQDESVSSLARIRAERDFAPVYQADVWKNDRGEIGVHKRVPDSEAAPPTTRDGQ